MHPQTVTNAIMHKQLLSSHPCCLHTLLVPKCPQKAGVVIFLESTLVTMRIPCTKSPWQVQFWLLWLAFSFSDLCFMPCTACTDHNKRHHMFHHSHGTIKLISIACVAKEGGRGAHTPQGACSCDPHGHGTCAQGIGSRAYMSRRPVVRPPNN